MGQVGQCGGAIRGARRRGQEQRRGQRRGPGRLAAIGELQGQGSGEGRPAGYRARCGQSPGRVWNAGGERGAGEEGRGKRSGGKPEPERRLVPAACRLPRKRADFGPQPSMPPRPTPAHPPGVRGVGRPAIHARRRVAYLPGAVSSARRRPPRRPSTLSCRWLGF